MKKHSKFEKSQDSIGFTFWQTHMLWSRQVKKVLTPFKLSHTQFVILSVISYLGDEKTEVSQVDVSEMSQIDTMTISTSIKTLLKNGYLHREKSQHDTRAYKLYLSDLGEEALKKSLVAIEAIDQAFFYESGIEVSSFLGMLHELNGQTDA